MATKEQSINIDMSITVWIDKTPIERARAVLSWCYENNVNTEITDEQLAAGMTEYPYWTQAPVNYLDLVLAINRMGFKWKIEKI